MLSFRRSRGEGELPETESEQAQVVPLEKELPEINLDDPAEREMDRIRREIREEE